MAKIKIENLIPKKGKKTKKNIIKLEKEVKQDLVVEGRVWQRGALYFMLRGEDSGKAFKLDKIHWDDKAKDWFLILGNGEQFNAKFAKDFIEEDDIRNYYKCECSFLCEGYVLKDGRVL